MMMSLETIAAIADPTVKRMAEDLRTVQGVLIENARARRQHRVEAIGRRMTPEGRTALLAKAADPGATFSMTGGKVTDPLDSWLDLLETSLPNLPGMLTTSGATLSEIPHPTDYSGEMSPERIAAIVEEQCRNTNIPPVKKSA